MAEYQWDCDAYGPAGREAGALCFFADPGTRNCLTHGECRQSVTAARQLLFDQIREVAALGDPLGIEMAETFTSPDQLLGGPAAITPADQRTDRP